MRIIAGQWRSRPIDWPRTGATRPITDRARQSLFDVLGARYGLPGSLPPLHVADIFAGGGSLGLEALSRGAGSVCFFERNAKALEILHANLDYLRAGPEAVVVATDIWRNLPAAPPNFGPFDLVFLDPPFADTRDTSETSRVVSLLQRLAQSSQLASNALCVLRHETKVHFEGMVGGIWMVDDAREIGGSAISLLVRHFPAPVGPDYSSSAEAKDPRGDDDALFRGR